MRKLILSLLCALSCAPAVATRFGTEVSDLWWVENESGWGVNVAQQSDTLFVTLFVYNTNGTPSWYVASNASQSAETGESFVGPLYQTSGPWFGTSFDPAKVGHRMVGTLSFTPVSGNSATLAYTVDGVSTSKSLTRQTWKSEDFNGTYAAGKNGVYTRCTVSGPADEFDIFTLNHGLSGGAFRLLTARGDCAYVGTYTQTGRLGVVTGTFTCTSGQGGTSGTFSLEDMFTSVEGFTAKMTTLTPGGCAYRGTLAAARRDVAYP